MRDAMERDRRTLVLDHVRTDTRVDGAGLKVADAECAVGVPLTMGDEFVAAMVVARTKRSPFTPDEVQILEDGGRPVTTAVANALALMCRSQEESVYQSPAPRSTLGCRGRQEITMPFEADVLRKVPLFATLDDEELGILSAQAELRRFAAQQRIYKTGAPAPQAYVLVSGSVRVTTVDEDQQEVVVNEPAQGEFFGFASMLEQTPHQTDAWATSDTECIEVDRSDILVLIQRRPHAAMEMMAVLGRQFHAAQQLIRSRSLRHPSEIIEEQATFGERIADAVAGFGGSWTFIILFSIVLTVYAAVNVSLDQRAWDPYPFILLNLFLSMTAAFQAPIIMMSQNRQDKKDRLRGDLDFDVNRRAHSEIQGLAQKLNLMGDRLADIQERLREKA